MWVSLRFKLTSSAHLNLWARSMSNTGIYGYNSSRVCVCRTARCAAAKGEKPWRQILSVCQHQILHQSDKAERPDTFLNSTNWPNQHFIIFQVLFQRMKIWLSSVSQSSGSLRIIFVLLQPVFLIWKKVVGLILQSHTGNRVILLCEAGCSVSIVTTRTISEMWTQELCLNSAEDLLLYAADVSCILRRHHTPRRPNPNETVWSSNCVTSLSRRYGCRLATNYLRKTFFGWCVPLAARLSTYILNVFASLFAAITSVKNNLSLKCNESWDLFGGAFEWGQSSCNRSTNAADDTVKKLVHSYLV